MATYAPSTLDTKDRDTVADTDSAAISTVGFLVQPGLEMLGLASALSVLHHANHQHGKPIYRWLLISPDGGPVYTADRLEVQVNQSVAQADPAQLDTLIVCASASNQNAQLNGLLQRCSHIQLGAFGNGALLLAETGLLDGFACAVQWDLLPALRGKYPDVGAQPVACVIDRNRLSCQGGSSALELMLEMVAEQHGRELSQNVAEQLTGCNDSQLQTLSAAELDEVHPKLSEALALMEANLEEPVTPSELAGYVDLSTRQLERLFQRHLDCSPTRYYLTLRLNRAQQMLARTEKSVTEIAIASGFLSGTHFSRSYRKFFGITPREARKWLRFRPAPSITGNRLISNGQAPQVHA